MTYNVLYAIKPNQNPTYWVNVGNETDVCRITTEIFFLI